MTALVTESIGEQSALQPTAEFGPVTARLVGLAAGGLVSMFNPESQLFCHSLRQTDSGLVQVGLSPRYTMMCLLGLRKLEDSGSKSPVAIRPVLDKLLESLDWIHNIGDLGVLLWTCARLAPERIGETAGRVDLATALARFTDAQQRRTVELSWFLTGLAYAKLACPAIGSEFKNLAAQTYQLLLQNQNGHPVFAYHASDRNISGLNRSRIGCFADQVYPIYAFTRYAQAFGETDALTKASDCARHICGAQGALGQWWWHYDSRTGKVIGRYPVFSVHQHGMAPMVLLALGEATGTDFGPWIYKGLRWIADNELGCNMEDRSLQLVWRSIAPGKLARGWRVARSLLTGRADSESRAGLEVLHECRPYELGWLLYAFANQPWASKGFV